MRFVLTLCALVCTTGCSSESPAPADSGAAPSQHGAHLPDKSHSANHAMAMAKDGGAVVVAAESETPKAGQPAALRLMIHESDGAMAKAFEEVHQKKLHLILIRKGLDEFAHLHPKVDASGNITAEHTFPVGGEYFLFADYKLPGQEAATARGRIRVSGDAPPAVELTPDVPGLAKGDGVAARISLEDARTGGNTTIEFHVMDEAGTPVEDLEPYLGAMGHLVILSADGSQYVHAHPLNENSAQGGGVAFMAHFPKPGVYKGWGQFQRFGTVFTIPFVVAVD